MVATLTVLEDLKLLFPNNKGYTSFDGDLVCSIYNSTS
jgi:hypothetical protein